MLGSTLQSYLFAQAFGLYFVIMSVILLSRENYYRNKLIQEPMYPSLLSCSLALFIGIILVLLHNIWVFGPRGWVTLLCWLFLLRAILWLLIPERVLAVMKKVSMGKGYYAVVISMMLIGLYLMAKGSYLYVMQVTVV